MVELTTTLSLSEEDRQLLKDALALSERLQIIKKRWLNEKEASEYIGRSAYKIAEWRRKGKIPYYRIGEIIWYAADDLDLFIESLRVPPYDPWIDVWKPQKPKRK